MRNVVIILACTLALAGCATGDAPPAAPPPARAVDAVQIFNGRWYEIARTPMPLTDGCVAGTTDYLRGGDGRLIERDACRMGSPAGKEKSFRGPVTILDPGRNTRIRVGYVLYGLITINRVWWILDHGDGAGGTWMITANPQFTQLSLFSRDPRPSRAEIDRLTARAAALGYDTGKLEYPETFPAGAG